MPPPSVLSAMPTFTLKGEDAPPPPIINSTITGPFAPSPRAATSSATPLTLSVPTKIVRNILDLDFVEMAELLPDTWKLMEEEPGSCHQRRSQHRGPITDILVWIECYASMVSVLAIGYPSKTPQLMSYQKTIVKAHRTFTGEGWVTYDVCFRRKVAITKSLDWGEIDFTYITRPSLAGQS